MTRVALTAAIFVALGGVFYWQTTRQETDTEAVFPGDVEGETLYPGPEEGERLARVAQLETRAGNVRAAMNRPRQVAVAQARRSVDHGRRRDR